MSLFEALAFGFWAGGAVATSMAGVVCDQDGEPAPLVVRVAFAVIWPLVLATASEEQ